MFPSPRRVSVRTAQRLVLASLIALGLCACSGGDSSEPSVLDAEPSSSTGAPIGALSFAAGNVWGQGRALRVVPGADGSLSIVTTTGVYHLDGPGAGTAELDRFTAPTQIGPTALSADGVMLAVAASAGVRTYDLSAGGSVAAPELPPEAEITFVAFDQATRELVVDTLIGPYRSSDGVAPLRPVFAAAPSGSTALVTGGTLLTPLMGTADIMVARSGVTERHTLLLPDSASVLDAKSSPDGSILAVSIGVGPDALDRKDQILILDQATFEQRATIDTGLAMDPSGWTVMNDGVAVVDGGTLRVWSIEGAPQGGGASPVDAPIASLRPFAGGLLTVHANGGLTRWSSGAWEPTLIDAGGITLEDALITADGASAVTVDYYGRVSTWDLRAGTQVTSDNRFASGETTGVAMSDDGLLGVASSSGRVVVLDGSLTSQTSIQVSASPEYVGAVAFQPSTDAVATGIAERRSATSFDDSVTLWDGQEPSPRFRVGGEQQEVVGCSFFYSRIRFSHDGSTMAVTSHDFSVVLVDPTSGEVLKELAGDTSVLDVAFTPDDRLLVATYDNATVNVWETAGYSPVASYQGSPGGYSAIAMMPDSNTMAATDITGAISLIDVMTGAPERSFADAAFRTTTLALSPDGALLAAPAADATINLWSTETGTRLATLTGHTAEVTGLVFSPDSGWLASSSSDGTVRTWTLRATN